MGMVLRAAHLVLCLKPKVLLEQVHAQCLCKVPATCMLLRWAL